MMKTLKYYFLFLLISLPNFLNSQSISIDTTEANPIEINPLLGNNVSFKVTYTSEANATNNHLYIGLEILNQNNEYVSTVTDITLENVASGSNLEKEVSLFISSNNKASSALSSGQYYQIKAVLYKNNWSEIAWAGFWNTPKLILQNKNGFTYNTKIISKGADISWMTEMQANGFNWKDNNGSSKELMPLLKEYSLNAVRLRVWVNPENTSINGWCDIEDMVVKAKLAKEADLDIMLTIHYSDFWADPGKQFKPAAWQNMSVSELETAIGTHTTSILNALQNENIKPKWIQIGNETSDGLLWPTGKASENGFENYAKFLNAGANAVKTFDNTIQTIIHLSNGNDNSLYLWNIGGLLNEGLVFENFDIIGLSLYPSLHDWEELVDAAYNNMQDLKRRYKKEVMLVEVGSENSRPDIAYQFLVYAIEKTKKVGGLGVFYWEPIAHNNWQSYSKGAWDADGSPSVAMDAFINTSNTLSTEISFKENKKFKVYPNPSSKNLQIIAFQDAVKTIQIFDVNGKLIRTENNIDRDFMLDISLLSNGLYFLKINSAYTYQFIKE